MRSFISLDKSSQNPDKNTLLPNRVPTIIGIFINLLLEFSSVQNRGGKYNAISEKEPRGVCVMMCLCYVLHMGGQGNQASKHKPQNNNRLKNIQKKNFTKNRPA